MRATIVAVLLIAWAWAAPAHADEAEVRGRIVDVERRPVEAADVLIRTRAGEHRVTTDAEGHFVARIQRATDEHYVVLDVRKTQDEHVLRWLNAHPAASLHDRAAPLVLRRTHPIEFTVWHDGAPAPGARFAIYTGSRYARFRLMTAQADGEGLLRLRMPPETYAWRSDDRRFGFTGTTFQVPRPKEVIRPGSYDPSRIVLRTPRDVRVRAVDDRTNAPVPGARLSLSSQMNGWGELYPDEPEYVTDSDGVVVVRRLAGPFTLTAGAANPSRVATVRVEADETDLELRLRHSKTWTLRMQIETNGHEPPNGAALRFRDTHCGEVIDRPARVEDGHVVLDDWSADRAWGHVVYNDRQVGWIHYDINYGPARKLEQFPVRFVPLSQITLRFVDPQGRPAKGVQVRYEGKALMRDPDGMLARTSAQGTSDARGEIRWEGCLLPARTAQVDLAGRQGAAPGSHAGPAPGADLRRPCASHREAARHPGRQARAARRPHDQQWIRADHGK